MCRAVLAACVAGLVVLAGCGGIGGQSGGGTPTVTPAPVPTATDDGGPSALAPGLTVDGVVDPASLAAAHRAALDGRSFTRVRTEERRYANGTLRERYRSTVGFGPGATRYRYRLVQVQQRGDRRHRLRLERYANGTRVYVATEQDGATTYGVLTGRNGRPVDPASVYRRATAERSGFARLAQRLRLAVADRSRTGGHTHYRVTVEDGTQTLPPLRNVTLDATVREDGLVERYQLTYDIRYGGPVVHVVVTVAYRDLGEPAVESPSWLPAARNATVTRRSARREPNSPPTRRERALSARENGSVA